MPKIQMMSPMINILSWNIRGIGSKGSLERLQLFKQQYNLSLICIQEPMVDNSKMSSFQRRLNMQNGFFNCSNKIWLFWSSDIDMDIIKDGEQQVLIRVGRTNEVPIFLTIVYAKCTEALRNDLWNDLRDTASAITGPWGVIGDFNVIISSEEKKEVEIIRWKKAWISSPVLMIVASRILVIMEILLPSVIAGPTRYHLEETR